MESYVTYIRSLLKQGIAQQAIVNDLRQRQLSDDLINQLLQAAYQASPPQATGPPAEAFIDYVKMLATRGMSQEAIADNLKMRRLDNAAITEFRQLAKKTQPASYPQAMQRYSADETQTTTRA